MMKDNSDSIIHGVLFGIYAVVVLLATGFWLPFGVAIWMFVDRPCAFSECVCLFNGSVP